jgi:hypothetical protein
MNPGWYTDGSGLFTEAMQIGDQYVTAALSVSDSNIVLALGFGADEGKSFTVTPGQAASILSDSSANMVLLPTNGPAGRLPKNDLSVKKQFKKDATFTVSAGHVSAGYLFFPNDPDASVVTVVVNFGDATFRFPFRRNPNFKAKFGALDNVPSSGLINEPKGAATATGAAVATPSGSFPKTPTTSAINGQLISAQTTNTQRSNTLPMSTGKCTKTVTFGSLDGGQMSTVAPSFAAKWVEKNYKKYPALCFAQSPSADTSNILLVVSRAQNAYNGFYPTTRTSTATNTSPTYGSGTVTDNYGGMWNYTYSGTVTTTTTTTSQVNLPYTDTTQNLYIYVYDSTGTLLSRHERSLTTRQGGDGANTLGYNLGAALGAIHLREGLLKEAVASVEK